MQNISDLFVDGIIRIVFADKGGNDDKCIYMQHPDYTYSVKDVSDLPVCSTDSSRVVVVSDTHDCHHKIGQLPDCDLLVHCGDIMMTSKHFSHKNCLKKISSFNDWLATCNAKQRIVLGGNHDHFLEKLGPKEVQEILSNATYLENSSCNLASLTIWGSPLSSGKSRNRAFQSREFMRKTMEKKPSEVDILITHGLCEELTSSIKHKIHIWGHSHNSYGIRYPGDFVKVHSHQFPITSLSLCVPLMNGRFKMHNLPVVIDVPKESSKLDSIPTAAEMVGHVYAARSDKGNGRYDITGSKAKEDIDLYTGHVENKEKPIVGIQARRLRLFGLFGFNRVLPSKVD